METRQGSAIGTFPVALFRFTSGNYHVITAAPRRCESSSYRAFCGRVLRVFLFFNQRAQDFDDDARSTGRIRAVLGLMLRRTGRNVVVSFSNHDGKDCRDGAWSLGLVLYRGLDTSFCFTAGLRVGSLCPGGVSKFCLFWRLFFEGCKSTRFIHFFRFNESRIYANRRGKYLNQGTTRVLATVLLCRHLMLITQVRKRRATRRGTLSNRPIKVVTRFLFKGNRTCAPLLWATRRRTIIFINGMSSSALYSSHAGTVSLRRVFREDEDRHVRKLRVTHRDLNYGLARGTSTRDGRRTLRERVGKLNSKICGLTNKLITHAISPVSLLCFCVVGIDRVVCRPTAMRFVRNLQPRAICIRNPATSMVLSTSFSLKQANHIVKAMPNDLTFVTRRFNSAFKAANSRHYLFANLFVPYFSIRTCGLKSGLPSFLCMSRVAGIRIRLFRRVNVIGNNALRGYSDRLRQLRVNRQYRYSNTPRLRNCNVRTNPNAFNLGFVNCNPA